MCQLKSGIILKDRIYISESDSHTDMLKELGIEDNRKNAESLFVRAVTAQLSCPIGQATTRRILSSCKAPPLKTAKLRQFISRDWKFVVEGSDEKTK
jgi:hypothetical protein